MRHILVTGGAGFIGSNIIRTQLLKNFKVTTIDNFDTFYPRDLKESNIADFRDNKNFNATRNEI